MAACSRAWGIRSVMPTRPDTTMSWRNAASPMAPGTTKAPPRVLVVTEALATASINIVVK